MKPETRALADRLAAAVAALGHPPTRIADCAGDEDIIVRFHSGDRAARLDVYEDGVVFVGIRPGAPNTYSTVAEEDGPARVAAWLGGEP